MGYVISIEDTLYKKRYLIREEFYFNKQLRILLVKVTFHR